MYTRQGAGCLQASWTGNSATQLPAGISERRHQPNRCAGPNAGKMPAARTSVGQRVRSWSALIFD